MLRLANLWPCLYLGFTSYGHDVPRELRVTSGKRQTKNDVLFRLSPSASPSASRRRRRQLFYVSNYCLAP